MSSPNPPVVIRPLSPHDAARWRPLWQAYLAFYDTVLPDAVINTAFARLTDPEVTDYHGLVAESKGQLIGLTHYLYHRHGWKLEPVCYLQDLFTAAPARGTGVGEMLIQAVYDAADAAGAPSVYWMTQADNATARRLYDRVATLTPFVKYQRRAA